MLLLHRLLGSDVGSRRSRAPEEEDRPIRTGDLVMMTVSASSRKGPPGPLEPFIGLVVEDDASLCPFHSMQGPLLAVQVLWADANVSRPSWLPCGLLRPLDETESD